MPAGHITRTAPGERLGHRGPPDVQPVEFAASSRDEARGIGRAFSGALPELRWIRSVDLERTHETGSIRRLFEPPYFDIQLAVLLQHRVRRPGVPWQRSCLHQLRRVTRQRDGAHDRQQYDERANTACGGREARFPADDPEARVAALAPVGRLKSMGSGFSGCGARAPDIDALADRATFHDRSRGISRACSNMQPATGKSGPRRQKSMKRQSTCL